MANTKCNCGGKTIQIKAKKAHPKKVAPKKVAPKKITDSKRSKRLSKIATKKANARPNPFGKGCKCS